MAKRFTDSEKWKDDWFSDLPPDIKLCWLYILDNCSHSGIWKKNFKLLSYCLGTVIDSAVVETHLDGRIFVMSNGDWFIPKFLNFQYSNGIGGQMPAIVSVRKTLEKEGLIETVIKQFGNSFVTVKDKDKDKDKNKDKDKEKISNTNTIGQFENFEPFRPEEQPPDRSTFFIPQMFDIWKAHCPGYAGDENMDFEPLSNIVKFLVKQEGLKKTPYEDADTAETIKLIWDSLAETIAKDKFLSRYSLSQVSKYIQSIIQTYNNEQSNSKTGGSGCDLLEAKRLIDQMSD